MKRIGVVHIETREREVHYDSPFGVDYTLCGDALDECAEPPTDTGKRVTCARCMLIVQHVRGRHDP